MSLFLPPNSKYWHYEFYYEGQRFRRSTRMKLKSMAKLVEAKKKLALRESHVGVRKEKPRASMFIPAADAFLKERVLNRSVARNANTLDADERERADKRDKNARYQMQSAVSHLSGQFRSRLLVDISCEDVTRYQYSRQKDGAANSTINHEVGFLRQLLKKHGLWSHIADGVKMLPKADDFGCALTPLQEHITLHECARSRSRVLLPFVQLLLLTGARFSTIQLLHWRQIDLIKRVIRIGADKSRYSTGRDIPLGERASKIVHEWAAAFPNREPNDYLFPPENLSGGVTVGKNGHLSFRISSFGDPSKHIGSLRKSWDAVRRATRYYCPDCQVGLLLTDANSRQKFSCSQCSFTTDTLSKGLSRIRLHDLRHTAVSRMVTAKVPLPMIAKIVGWSPATLAQMVARYGHYTLDELRSAVEAVDVALPELPDFTSAELKEVDASHYLSDCTESPSTTEKPNAFDDVQIRRPSYDRDALYEDVWSHPRTKLQQKYGVSAVAIQKACRKLHVPTPSRGYWAKKAAGVSVGSRPPLPKL